MTLAGTEPEIGSLFAGIGGLELGLERAIPSARTAWQVEIDPFCRRVLARHWPYAERHDDVCTFPTPTTPRVDIICGGFPCQDLSVAGGGAGLDGERSGLFFEYMRIVRALRPRVVVMENVSALLARGMGRVLGELASCGYDAEWDCIPAAAVGAPHERDRVFIVAYADRNDGRDEGRPDRAPARHKGLAHAEAPDADGEKRRPSARAPVQGRGNEAHRHASTNARGRGGRFVPREHEWGSAPPAVRRMDDGLSPGVDRPRRRRPDNDPPRLRALGNAVVPQVAEVIGRRVAELLEVTL